MENQRKVAIYVRQSMTQDEGIDRQLRRCRALAEARGWEVVAELVDNNVSASKSRDAAEWGTLVAGAKEGRWDVVIAVKLDRLARRVRDVLDLADLGLAIVTLEGDIDTTTDVGRFQATLLASLAELEVARLGQRKRDAHADRSKRGIPRTTKRPFGWQSDGIHLKEDEADHLRIAITNIVAGGSAAREARRMNEAGARTPNYKSGSGGMEFTARRVISILDRPRIAGINTYLGVTTEHSQIEPVVPVEVWEEYRAIRQDPSRLSRSPGRTPLKHWLSNVCYCPCGDVLGASSAQGRGKRYSFYRCRQTGRGAHVGIKAETLENYVQHKVYAEMVRRMADTRDTGNVRILRLRKQAISEQMDAAAELEVRATTAPSRSAARRALVRLEEEWQATDSALREALVSVQAHDWRGFYQKWFEDADVKGSPVRVAIAYKDFEARWADMPVEVKRDITNLLVDIQVLPSTEADRIIVTPKSGAE
jgi:DNA invertase Pin-like site-specific DNA recombinase